ncbi:MAG: hypothetical protein KC776_43440 [Myxococcales bacterium]|nr:hypothetical protein [Myxococcales bacterium]MCB9582291.1 hypothetical protein [Polyangiaceae bacterium]
MGPGVRIPRLMVIVRSGSDLTLISSLRLSSQGEAELERLGTVKHVVKIGYAHGMDDAYNLQRFGAQYWALPGGARAKDPKPEQELTPDHLPFDDAELFVFEQTLQKEAALLVKRAGGILITCDAVQNWPSTEGCSLMAKPITHLMGFTARPAQIGPPWRKGMTPPGGSLRADFERLAALDFKHLIGGHGAPLRDTAKADLQKTVEATFAS